MKSNTKAVSTEEMLLERKKTHGDFTENAQISQNLKAVLHGSSGWATLSADKKEALEMVMHKTARICTGNAEEADHWVDIGGYSKLAQNRCKPEVGSKVSKRS